MNSDLSQQTLRERILDAHLRIRAADIGQHIAAFIGKPKNSKERKAARLRILPILTSLTKTEEIECHSTVRPFISPDDIAVADLPFIRWSPGDVDPRFSLFTCEAHFGLGSLLPPTPGKVFAKFTKVGCFSRQIGRPTVRQRSINFPWVNIYTTSVYTTRTNYGREVPIPEYLKFSPRHCTPLEFVFSSPESEPSSGPLLNAELCVDHQLMVTAIYFDLLQRSPSTAIQWLPLGILESPDKLGQLPDALIGPVDAPKLAIGYAGPLANISAIHRYCKERNLPYELWGHRRTEAWYNACCQIAYIQAIRNLVLSNIGPAKYAPALTAIASKE
jgi:hypothetical protein